MPTTKARPSATRKSNAPTRNGWFDVTPVMAQRWLATMGGNRQLRRGAVERLEETLTDGSWKRTNDAVVFDTKGRLRNGQHRLTAIVNSGVTAELLVAIGLDPDAFDVIDTHASRTSADVLAIAGFANASLVASACRWELYYRSRQNRRSMRSSPAAILKLAKSWKGVRESAAFINSGPSKAMVRMLPGSILTWLHRRIADGCPELADEFIGLLVSGENISRGNPIYALRERLLQNKGSMRGKLSSRQMLAFCVKAWNAWVTEEELLVLKQQYRKPGRKAKKGIRTSIVPDFIEVE